MNYAIQLCCVHNASNGDGAESKWRDESTRRRRASALYIQLSNLARVSLSTRALFPGAAGRRPAAPTASRTAGARSLDSAGARRRRRLRALARQRVANVSTLTRWPSWHCERASGALAAESRGDGCRTSNARRPPLQSPPPAATQPEARLQHILVQLENILISPPTLDVHIAASTIHMPQLFICRDVLRG